MSVDNDLLQNLKTSLGDLSGGTELDAYYNNKLNQAISELTTDDIDDEILNSKLGRLTIVHYTYLLINNLDIATNPTLTLLKNKLSCMTKGERYD